MHAEAISDSGRFRRRDYLGRFQDGEHLRISKCVEGLLRYA